MKKLKFLNENHIILSDNTLLIKANYTKDLNEFYTIKNENYAKI